MQGTLNLITGITKTALGSWRQYQKFKIILGYLVSWWVGTLRSCLNNTTTTTTKPRRMVNCNLSTWVAEAEGLTVWGHPRLHNKTLLQGKKREKGHGREGKRRKENKEQDSFRRIMGLQSRQPYFLTIPFLNIFSSFKGYHLSINISWFSSCLPSMWSIGLRQSRSLYPKTRARSRAGKLRVGLIKVVARHVLYLCCSGGWPHVSSIPTA